METTYKIIGGDGQEYGPATLAELQAWVLRRHEELEQQRLQLITREQELDAQERARQEIHSRVEEEILGYQRQIRQLSAQLRCKQELGRLRDSA